MLQAIEKATRSKIELMELPSTDLINNKRIANFKQSISDTLAAGDLKLYQEILEQFQFEHNVPALDIAAALAKLLGGDKPLLLKKEAPQKPQKEFSKSEKPRSKTRTSNERFLNSVEEGMERYRLEVGHNHNVKPGNIVGAIANEAGIESKHIGRINIFDDYSVVDLPAGMPKEIFQHLKDTYVAGRKIQLSLYKSGQDTNQNTDLKPKQKSDTRPKRKPRRAKINKDL